MRLSGVYGLRFRHAYRKPARTIFHDMPLMFATSKTLILKRSMTRKLFRD